MRKRIATATRISIALFSWERRIACLVTSSAVLSIGSMITSKDQ